jgi:hypothetical protein
MLEYLSLRPLVSACTIDGDFSRLEPFLQPELFREDYTSLLINVYDGRKRIDADGVKLLSEKQLRTLCSLSNIETPTRYRKPRLAAMLLEKWGVGKVCDNKVSGLSFFYRRSMTSKAGDHYWDVDVLSFPHKVMDIQGAPVVRGQHYSLVYLPNDGLPTSFHRTWSDEEEVLAGADESEINGMSPNDNPSVVMW